MITLIYIGTSIDSAMQLIKKILTCFICFNVFFIYSQKNNNLNLKKPIYIEKSIYDSLIIKIDKSPLESLKYRTISYKSEFSFEKEHHSIWYLIELNNCGQFTFTLTPDAAKDDYDFMIFKVIGDSIDEKLAKGELELIRSNISRNDTINKGITGLSTYSNNNYTKKGINSSFSKSIKVKNGDRLLIVFDNVYENGKGFKCNFKIKELNQFKTKTKNAITKSDLKCDNQLCNSSGKILRAEFSLSNEFVYKFKAENFEDNIDYDLNKEFCFLRVEKKGFFPDFILKSDINCINDNMIIFLQPLKLNNFYFLKDVFFNSDNSINIEKSNVSISVFKEFLRKNPNLKFELTNCINSNDDLNAKSNFIKYLNLNQDKLKSSNLLKDTTLSYKSGILLKLVKYP